jgi:hypothetical protein
MKTATEDKKSMVKHLIKSESRKSNGGINPLPYSRMEAIARGVEARLEERTGHSRKITNETVNIARALGVAYREIEKWRKERQILLDLEEARISSLKERINMPGGNRANQLV